MADRPTTSRWAPLQGQTLLIKSGRSSKAKNRGRHFVRKTPLTGKSDRFRARPRFSLRPYANRRPRGASKIQHRDRFDLRAASRRASGLATSGAPAVGPAGPPPDEESGRSPPSRRLGCPEKAQRRCGPYCADVDRRCEVSRRVESSLVMRFWSRYSSASTSAASVISQPSGTLATSSSTSSILSSDMSLPASKRAHSCSASRSCLLR